MLRDCPTFGNKLQRRRACATQTSPRSFLRSLRDSFLAAYLLSILTLVYIPTLAHPAAFFPPSSSPVPLVSDSPWLPSLPPLALAIGGSGNASLIRRSHEGKMTLDLNKNTTFGAAFAGFAASCLYVLVSVRMTPFGFPVTSIHCTKHHPCLPIVHRFLHVFCYDRGDVNVLFWKSNRCLGIQTMQTYTYFRRFPLDRSLYKALVRWVIVFCTSLMSD